MAWGTKHRGMTGRINIQLSWSQSRLLIHSHMSSYVILHVENEGNSSVRFERSCGLNIWLRCLLFFGIPHLKTRYNCFKAVKLFFGLHPFFPTFRWKIVGKSSTEFQPFAAEAPSKWGFRHMIGTGDVPPTKMASSWKDHVLKHRMACFPKTFKESFKCWLQYIYHFSWCYRPPIWWKQFFFPTNIIQSPTLGYAAKIEFLTIILGYLPSGYLT